MSVRRIAVTLALAVSCALAQDSPDADAKRILDRFQALRPAVAELGWYQLDWAPSLKEARAKAAADKRPICLLVCLNVYGNLYTGHC